MQISTSVNRNESRQKPTKTYRNPFKSMNSCEIKNTMKALHWQEDSLESSNGFYRGNRSYLTIAKLYDTRFTTNHEQSMNIYENR